MKRILLSFYLVSLSSILFAQEKNLIPYKVANQYFLKNTLDTTYLMKPIIETKEEFDRLFGEGPLMGEASKHTSIDFEKEFVIAVFERESAQEVLLIPKSLKKVKKGNLELEFLLKEGQTKGFQSVPTLILVVDRKNKANVILKQIK